MKNRTNVVPVLQRISESVDSDVIGLISAYIGGHLGFDEFKSLWKARRFSCIHHACPERLYYGVFLQILFDSAIRLFKYNHDDNQDHVLISAPWNCGVVFVLFCLHQTQLHGDRPHSPIFITVNQISTMQSCLTASREACFEGLSVLTQMINENCFALSTYSGPQCLLYAEKYKSIAMNCTQLSSFSKTISELAKSTSVIQTTSTHEHEAADAVNESDDVIAKLEELIPARRAHKRLVAEAVVERRRTRQAAEAQKLQDRLSKMSQPRVSRRLSKRITADSQAALIASDDKIASGDDKKGKRKSPKLSTLTTKDNTGFNSFTTTTTAAASASANRKKKSNRNSGDTVETVVGDSLVDDLEAMIRQSGEVLVKPQLKKRQQQQHPGNPVAAVTTEGAGVNSSSSSRGVGGTANRKQTTARIKKNQAPPEPKSSAKVSNKSTAVEKKSSGSSSSSTKKTKTTDRPPRATPARSSSSRSSGGDSRKAKKVSTTSAYDNDGNSGEAGGESVLQLLEELERDTAEALERGKMSRRSSNRGKGISEKGSSSTSSRRSINKNAMNGDDVRAASSELSVLAMVEDLERDSAETLLSHRRRKKSDSGSSNARKRKLGTTSAVVVTDVDTSGSKKTKKAATEASHVVNEIVPTNSVLDMLQELERDSSAVLGSKTRAKNTKKLGL